MTVENSLPSEALAVAAELVEARASGKRLMNTALPVPVDARSAMQIQALVQKQLARPVGGWKVAVAPEIGPVAAPLLDVHPISAEISLFPNCTIEVELAVRLAMDLPKRETGVYQRSDILKAIESVVLGIEVIGGRFNATNVPFLSFLADNLGNRAYIIGDKLPLSTVDTVNELACHVTLGKYPLYQSTARHPASDPLMPLLSYANAQSDYLGGLRAGQIVTTGSLCGVLPVRTSGLLTARLGEAGKVTAQFT